MTITAAQCRAARGLLGWNQADMAAEASINKWTIQRFEGGRPVSRNSIQHMRRALEAGGVIFIQGDDEADEGVRLVKGAGGKSTVEGADTDG
jgi:ribosome-binding protein aMBF1 (putative translation factor)